MSSQPHAPAAQISNFVISTAAATTHSQHTSRRLEQVCVLMLVAVRRMKIDVFVVWRSRAKGQNTPMRFARLGNN